MKDLSLAFLFFFLFQLLQAQNNLDKTGLGASAPSSAAFSLRLLSTAYTGNAIQVRRSSDNATQDIGFTINGDLDTTALKSFVGTNDGFVSIWYDQSGSTNNITQPTAVYQPSIILAGVIHRENAKPFIRFFGVIASSNFQSLVLTTEITTVGHISAVHRFEPAGDGFILGHTAVYYWHSNAPSTLISSLYASASVKAGSGWTNGTPYSPVSMPWPSVLTISEIEPSPSTSLTNWNNIGTDRITAHNTTGGGGYSELINFINPLSVADRHALEANQNAYYAINAILPLTWIDFNAQLQDKKIVLAWQTAAEQNSRNFTIQHSINGNDWLNIGKVPAAGNSNEPHNYTYTDAQPAAGDNYYRLLATDADEKSSYSKVIKLHIISPDKLFTIIANPVKNGRLQVQVKKNIFLSLYSIDGKEFWKKQYAPGLQDINLSGVAKGVYVLRSGATTEKLLLQ